MSDLFISGGYVVTMDSQRRVIEDGAVAVKGKFIEEVGPRTEIEARHKDKQLINAKGKVVLPGLIDGHGHAGHSLVKTLGAGRTGAWAETVDKIYAESTDAQFWYADALLTSLERIKFGVTTGVSFFGGGTMVVRSDEPLYGDSHCRAIKEMGIREFLAVGPSNPPYPRKYVSWENDASTEKLVEFDDYVKTSESLINKWHGQSDGKINLMVMLPVHNPENSMQDLDALKYQASTMRGLSKKHNIIFAQDGHSRGTVKFAHEELELLGPDVLLSHSTGLTDEEILICKETDTKIVHNPSAVAAIMARCPVPELIDAGVTVILGSDGNAPDRSFDMFRHMAQCMHYQRTHFHDPSYMPNGKILEMVTIDSAKALGIQEKIGSLEINKSADIILIDMEKPHLYPPNMPLFRITNFASGHDVHTVIVDGAIIMEDRVTKLVNEKDVLCLARNATDTMLDRANVRDLLTIPEGFWGKSKFP
ncbi:MAG: Cytosine/adenosine deaminase [Chloroflexi bacterium]|jgi:cytosine/adenosine deaminase-related metal-dependent hydrolase|nr:MAG: Cytosine/adenosine deaminase [Chloroflexota bacterium]